MLRTNAPQRVVAVKSYLTRETAVVLLMLMTSLAWSQGALSQNSRSPYLLEAQTTAGLVDVSSADDTTGVNGNSPLGTLQGLLLGRTRFESMRAVGDYLYYVEYELSGPGTRQDWSLHRYNLLTSRLQLNLPIAQAITQYGPDKPSELATVDGQVVFVSTFQRPYDGTDASLIPRAGLWKTTSNNSTGGSEVDFLRQLPGRSDNRSFQTVQSGRALSLRSTVSSVSQRFYTLYGRSIKDVIAADMQTGESLDGTAAIGDTMYGLKTAYENTTGGYVSQLYSFPSTNRDRVNATFVKRIVDQAIIQGTTTKRLATTAGPWRVKRKFLFFANDLINGCELWVSDGQASGTRLLKDINTGIGDSVPIGASCADYAPPQSGGVRAVVRQGVMYFYAFDGIRELLWRSDGTETGTRPVNTSGVPHYSPFSLQKTIKGWTYYAVADSSVEPLWKTNGELLYTSPAKSGSANDPSAGGIQGRVKELVVAKGRLFALTFDGDKSRLFRINKEESVAPQPSSPINLNMGERDSNRYGEKFGSNAHPQRVVFEFISSDGAGALLTVRGYDLERYNEVEVRLNTKRVGYLDDTQRRSNRRRKVSQVNFIELDEEDVKVGTNTLEFFQRANSDAYGVTKVRVVPFRGPERTLAVSSVDRERLGFRYGNGSNYPVSIPVRFSKTASDAELKFRSFDINTRTEVSVWINNRRVAFLDTTAEKGEARGKISIPLSLQQDSNVIEFRQEKAGNRWGIRNLLLRTP